MRSWLPAIFLTSLLPILPGCASLNPWKDEEYARAKNAIEGYEDTEGNWVRPEGISADKRRNSDLPKFLQKIPGVGARPVNKELARSKYREADEIFRKATATSDETERRKLFRSAGKKYIDAGKDWVSSALEQDAYFMAAESSYFAEDYPKAEDYYLKLIKEYPRTRYQDRVDQRRSAIGHYWLQFPDKFYNVNLTDNKKPLNDTQNHGKRVMDKIRLDSPTSSIADDVTMEIANTEFQRENWNEALDAYRDLIQQYPDSPHQFDAHFLGVKAALLAYQGPQYAAEPLDHADSMLKKIGKLFPTQAQEHQDKIREAMAEVKYRKAERLFEEAQYRANKQEYGAAQIYCEKILADYEDTPFGDKAKQILGKADGKPVVPTPYLHFMTKAFPTRDKITPLLKPTESEANMDNLVRQGDRNKPTVHNASSDNSVKR